MTKEPKGTDNHPVRKTQKKDIDTYNKMEEKKRLAEAKEKKNPAKSNKTVKINSKMDLSKKPEKKDNDRW
jgi:hypothetical protein